LIDQLLERPEYADYWAMKWSDLLRVDRDAITPAGAVAVTRWLRKQFATNRPYDEMVRAIVTARGAIGDESPAAIYKSMTTPEDLSRSFSQLFLGIRIQCAQCHHHPSDKWGQEDYFALAGFFTGIGYKAPPGGSDIVFAMKGRELPHPRTKKLVPVRALGAPAIDLTNIPDRRVVLARWMTTPENPTFTRAIANRMWSHYFGRGLVEPLDDLRATNPATNEPLLEALAKDLRDKKYDLKAFTRTLLNSRLYQLASPTMSAAKPFVPDEQNFSHAQPRAIPAEVLLDAISQATGVPEKFNGWPDGYRAIQIWDNRMPSYFFRIFGRPVRATVCECERSNEPSIAQALHLMNSEEIHAKIRSRHGAARRLAQSKMTPAEIIDELCLSTLSRFPTEAESKLLQRVFTEAEGNRQEAVEDALWALLNTRSFVYNH
jgi:AraC-like DNA-binding protein